MPRVGVKVTGWLSLTVSGDLMLDINSTSESSGGNQQNDGMVLVTTCISVRAAPEQRGQQMYEPYRYGDEQQRRKQYWSSANATRIRSVSEVHAPISGKRSSNPSRSVTTTGSRSSPKGTRSVTPRSPGNGQALRTEHRAAPGTPSLPLTANPSGALRMYCNV